MECDAILLWLFIFYLSKFASDILSFCQFLKLIFQSCAEKLHQTDEICSLLQGPDGNKGPTGPSGDRGPSVSIDSFSVALFSH